jgi:hypothetical protein
MFGNITGGGTLSSKYHYNPTDYVAVIWEELPTRFGVTVLYFYDTKRYMSCAA